MLARVHGCPTQVFMRWFVVTDGGGIFKANQAKAVYRALGIDEEQIERRKPYQSYIETTFGIQKRMADWHFARAATFTDLARAHDTWREDYNAQRHWAHESRQDGRRSPEAVLGFYTALLRHREEDLRRAFFCTRSSRVLDALGYVRFSWTGGSTGRRRWRAGRPLCGCSPKA